MNLGIRIKNYQQPAMRILSWYYWYNWIILAIFGLKVWWLIVLVSRLNLLILLIWGQMRSLICAIVHSIHSWLDLTILKHTKKWINWPSAIIARLHSPITTRTILMIGMLFPRTRNTILISLKKSREWKKIHGLFIFGSAGFVPIKIWSRKRKLCLLQTDLKLLLEMEFLEILD